MLWFEASLQRSSDVLEAAMGKAEVSTLGLTLSYRLLGPHCQKTSPTSIARSSRMHGDSWDLVGFPRCHDLSLLFNSPGTLLSAIPRLGPAYWPLSSTK